MFGTVSGGAGGFAGGALAGAGLAAAGLAAGELAGTGLAGGRFAGDGFVGLAFAAVAGGEFAGEGLRRTGVAVSNLVAAGDFVGWGDAAWPKLLAVAASNRTALQKNRCTILRSKLTMLID